MIGDRYLSEYYTELQVYSCELFPYRLLVFMPVSILALEFFQQIISVDLLYFLPAKKGYILKWDNMCVLLW